MKVKLKVLQGKQAGRAIAIPTGKFLVGRAEQCHLRPKSDSISRTHCQITVAEDTVKVKDLNSRNGTFVNDEQVSSCLLDHGDQLRVGKIEFEVVIEDRAVVAVTDSDAIETRSDATDNSATKLSKINASESDDISDWLAEGDDFDRARDLADPDTRQFTMDLTENADGEQLTEEIDPKQEPGKLPKLPAQMSDTSRDAAADMLKKFFNRR